MDFMEYQEAAEATATYPEHAVINYPILGLVGEAGELANKYKKVIRDDNGVMSDAKREEHIAELGDVLWYCAALASDLDVSLDEVASLNLAKLQSRADRGVLAGSGDNR